MALHIPRPYRRWAWWGVRWLAAAVALYGCLFLLLAVGSMLDIAADSRSTELRIDAVRQVEGGYEILGHARAGSFVQATLPQKALGETVADRSGNFSLSFRPFALSWDRMSIRVIDPDTGEVLGGKPVPSALTEGLSAPLAVDTAYYIADAKLLWVAGRSEPFESISIVAGNGTVLSDYVRVDPFGVFDGLVPLAAPPQQIAVFSGVSGVSGVSGSRRSPPAKVTSRATADLPLARTLTIDESGPRPKISLAVTLPVSHPLFAGAAQGFLPAGELVNRVFGITTLRLREQGAYEVKQGRGTVRIESEDSSLPLFQLWKGEGIGSVPLLSPRDQVSVIFGKEPPAWLGEVPPTEMTGRGAVWRGPIRSASQRVLELRSSVLAQPSQPGSSLKMRTTPPDSQEQEAEKLRQFIRSFDQGGANPLQQVWRTAILLIPFLGFLIVARRWPLGPTGILAAAALVLAAWRCWSLLYSLVLAEVAPWLTRAVAWPLSLSRDDEALRRAGAIFSQVGPNAFWVLFVALVALVPVYFDNVSRAADGWQPPARPRRSRLRRAWTFLKLASGTVLLAALLLAMRQADRDPDLLFRKIESLTGTELLVLGFGSLFLALGCLFLASFGLRGLLLGLAMLLVNFYWIAQSPVPEALAEVPAPAILVLFGLAALPALNGLLARLLPFTPGEKKLRRLAAAILAAVCLLLPDLPIDLVLALGGALLAAGFGWVAMRTLSRSRRPWTVAALALAGFAIGWPFPQANAELRLSNLERLMGELGQLFPWLLALGVVLLLLGHARRSRGAILPKEALRLGAYLYAVFVINSSRTWLLVPVPLLAGLLLAAVWLFRPDAETSRLKKMLPARRRSLRELLGHLLGTVESADLLRSIRKSLTGKLEKAEIEPAEYERKLAVYRQYVEGKSARPAVSSRQPLRRLVFSVGYSVLTANTRAALGAGALLALAPLSIALYRYLPNEKVIHPYPLADLLVFLVGAIASWLLYAFFFGYFFAHLRGDTGLTKGIHLFSLVVLPFAALHLLDTSTWDEMRPFVLWAAQVFLFCSLLGLIAFDYGLLHRKGFAARDLRRVHDLPALSAYGSTVVAAIIPAVTAILTGRLTELVSFFLNTILPRVPGP